MSWITDIFSSGVDKVVDSVSKGLDNLFTSDEERLILKNEIEKALKDFEIQVEQIALQHEQEITQRWKSDNDNLLTRAVRPAAYVFILIVFALLVFTDGNVGEFKVNPAYVPVIETLLITMTIAYFGSRGAEKVTKFFKKEV